ncbi:molybdenum ABC transporter, periplasmic molybdate-binding protein [Leptolyngbya sp. PCC 7375]|nr:molybdenum ABC transporter, periplasmic molybdate-binding protein [Leptolyngbya sp. PCC 7375]
MQRRKCLTLFLTGLASGSVAMGCSREDQTVGSGSTITLTISAAASLQDALEKIISPFTEAHPDIAIDYNFASSGALQRQIEQGAPADIFFAAASKQMDALSDKGLILPDSRQDLVANRLALVTAIDSALDITDIAELKTTDVNSIAVGEFRSVPAGQYAQQAFQQLELLDTLQSKFVFSNNVRSVLAAVESGNVELGIVYATDAALSRQVKVLATVPEEFHLPIVYPIAIVSNSAQPAAAQRFIDFLTTETAQTMFTEFGFNAIRL